MLAKFSFLDDAGVTGEEEDRICGIAKRHFFFSAVKIIQKNRIISSSTLSKTPRLLFSNSLYLDEVEWDSPYDRFSYTPGHNCYKKGKSAFFLKIECSKM